MAEREKTKKTRTIRGAFLRTQALFLLVVVGGFSLLYFLFANNFYACQKSRLMKAAFQAVVNCTSLDAETLEVELATYEDANFRFKIVTEKDEDVYSTGIAQKLGEMENGKPQEWKKLYPEEPEIEYSGTLISLRGSFDRDGCTYYVRITENIRSVGSSFTYIDAFLTVLLGLVIIVGLLTMWVMTSRMLRSIENINQVASRISRRDFSQKADESTRYRELRELEESINRMSEEIQDSLVYLEETNHILVEENRYKEKLNRMREEFLANISHELKTPLAIMSNHVELLQCMEDQIDRDYYYDSLMDEIHNMTEIVENLLELGSVEQGLENISLSPMDLSVTAERLREKVLALIQRRPVTLDYQCEKSLVVLGGERYLSQAMENYLTNAVKHVCEGGRICFRLVRDGEDALCTVYNDGDLIPEESMERIWRSFVVLSEDSEDEDERMSNTGLGLYIVQKIVLIHHGSCGVENESGGVCFWLRIPLYKEQENQDISE
ncbi:MAG: HAMP domain-containing histidine kinase [Lachnospiraceae bacterium]|nr:HAMP domain-containing histidine kinase [Lachnospiraceae bacterium]